MNNNRRSQNTSLGIVGFGAFGQLAALHLGQHFEISAYATRTELITKFKGTGYKPKPYTPDFEVICFDGRKLFVEVRHSGWQVCKERVCPNENRCQTWQNSMP